MGVSAMRMARSLGRLLPVVLVAVVGAGCGSEEVVHSLSEREANEILVVLDSQEIAATKMIEEGRVVTWKVVVPAKAAGDARRILVDYQLPKPKSTRLQEVYAQSGMIPTQSEEKAKMLIGIQGEIEQKLKLIPGVLDVHAQIVIPDKETIREINAAKPLPMASVVIVYNPINNELPYRVEDVQKAVATSVEEMTPDRVTVLSYKNRPFSSMLVTAAAAGGAAECVPGAVPTRNMLGVALGSTSSNVAKFVALLSVAGGLIALLLAFTVFFILSRIGLKKQLQKAMAENTSLKKARASATPQPA